MKKRVELQTDFLIPRTNFFVGIGSVLNLAGNYFEFNTSKTEKEADEKAIRSDWENVGRDIEAGRKEFEDKEIKTLCFK